MRFYGVFRGLVLLALFSGQTACSSSISNSAESLVIDSILEDEKRQGQTVYAVDYLIQPTEANLKIYADAYFHIFRHELPGVFGPIFELRHLRINEKSTSGFLLMALEIIKNCMHEASESRKQEQHNYAETLCYGLNLLREADFLASGKSDFQEYIARLKDSHAYCPGDSADSFSASPLLAVAMARVMKEFKEFNTAVIAQRCCELYWSAMRNYPELLGSFDDLSLVSVEAARKIYCWPNHTAFFAQRKCMETVSSEVLLVVLNQQDWELSEEQVKLLVEARGKKRLVSEICHDCRAWQVVRLMTPEHDSSDTVFAFGADTEGLFFDFDWDLFESCKSFSRAGIEEVCCPIQQTVAFMQYIVATERYLHNAIVMLHKNLESISAYYGVDETEILEGTEHRESLLPYISRVKKIVSLRVELKEMFKSDFFDDLSSIVLLLANPISHRVRMFMKQKGPLYLHLQKETEGNLYGIYSFCEQEVTPIEEAFSLLEAWSENCCMFSFEQPHFMLDFMFLLIDGLEVPEDHAFKEMHESLLRMLKELILNHAQRILSTDIDYFSALFPEHPVAFELQSYLVSPVCVGPFSRAVKELISLHAKYSISELAVANSLYEQDELMISALNSEWENIAADVRRIVQGFSACELIDRIFPQLATSPDALAMIARILGLFSRAQVDELVDLAKEIPMSASVASFIASPHGRRILSNASVLFKMEWEQLPTEMIKSMALATTSMPAWTGRDVLAIFRACDGIIHNFDAWLALIPDRVWRDLEVAAVVGVEVSFFSMLKVRKESIIYHSQIACTAALWFFDNVKKISPKEMCLFVAKWMIRWELNFLQWRMYLKQLSSKQFDIQYCEVYFVMHMWEGQARLFMIEALEQLIDKTASKLSSEKIANRLSKEEIAEGLVKQLKHQPASQCRLSYLMKHAKESRSPIRSERIKAEDYRFVLTSLKIEKFNDDLREEIKQLYLKIYHAEENEIIAQVLVSTFPKLGKDNTLTPKRAEKNHSSTVANLKSFLNNHESSKAQKTLWLMRTELCEKVDADGTISDPEEAARMKEDLKSNLKDLPLNDLAFMQYILNAY